MAKRAFPEADDLLSSYFEAELAEEAAACPPPPDQAASVPVGRAFARGADRAGAARGRGARGRSLEFAAAAAIAVSIGALAWSANGTGAAAGQIARSIDSGYTARAGAIVRDGFSSAFAAFAERARGGENPDARIRGARWRQSD